MTDKERELALYCLKASSDYHSEVCEECINYPNCDHTIQDDVTETIIKALEQEPCEDAISRQAVLDELNKWDCQELYLPIHFKENIIDVVPSVKPQEPQTGHWKRISMDKYVQHAMAYYKCSECGEDIIGEHNYCPDCGAKMESEG